MSDIFRISDFFLKIREWDYNRAWDYTRLTTVLKNMASDKFLTKDISPQIPRIMQDFQQTTALQIQRFFSVKAYILLKNECDVTALLYVRHR